MQQPTVTPASKMTGFRFATLAIAGMLSWFVILILVVLLQPVGYIILIFYILALLVGGFFVFLKVRKATQPTFAVSAFVFTTGALFSFVGAIVAYLMLKDKGLV